MVLLKHPWLKEFWDVCFKTVNLNSLIWRSQQLWHCIRNNSLCLKLNLKQTNYPMGYWPVGPLQLYKSTSLSVSGNKRQGYFIFTDKITIPSSRLLLGFHSSSLVQFLYFRTTSPLLDFLSTKQCGLMMLWRSIVMSAIQVLISNTCLSSSAWGFGVYDSIIHSKSSNKE